MIKYPHQLMLALHLFGYVCNMLFLHVCQQDNLDCFEWKLCTHSCWMYQKEQEPDLIWLANWIRHVTWDIPKGQQEVQMVFEVSEKNRKSLDILFSEKLQITYMFRFNPLWRRYARFMHLITKMKPQRWAISKLLNECNADNKKSFIWKWKWI